MAEKNVKEGDDVSQEWGNGQPADKVSEVATDGSLSLEKGQGNTVKENASEDNPAVHINRGEGNDVVGEASKVTKQNESGGGIEDEVMDEAGNGGKKEPEVGEKRARNDIDEVGREVSGGEGAGKEEGKEVKKPKVAEGEDVGTKDGSTDKDQHKREDAGQPQAGGDAEKSEQNEGPPAPKKRGPGRPKKGESKAEKAAPQEASNGDSVGRRTRSKT